MMDVMVMKRLNRVKKRGEVKDWCKKNSLDRDYSMYRVIPGLEQQPGASFRCLLGVGSEPIPTQWQLYRSDFSRFCFEIDGCSFFAMSCRKKSLSGVRLALKFACIEDANIPTSYLREAFLVVSENSAAGCTVES